MEITGRMDGARRSNLFRGQVLGRTRNPNVRPVCHAGHVGGIGIRDTKQPDTIRRILINAAVLRGGIVYDNVHADFVPMGSQYFRN